MTPVPGGAKWCELLAVVGVSVALATLAVFLLERLAGIDNASAAYLVAVVTAAIVVGTVGAVLASVASFLVYDYLFVMPTHTFTVSDPAEWLSLILLLFVGIVVGQLTAMQRARARAAEDRAREAHALFAVSRALVTRDTTQAGLASVAEVVRPQAAMSRVWMTLGADDASERIVADTDSGSPAGPAHARARPAAVGAAERRGVLPLGPCPPARRAQARALGSRRLPRAGRGLRGGARLDLRGAGTRLRRADHGRDPSPGLGSRPGRPGGGP